MALDDLGFFLTAAAVLEGVALVGGCFVAACTWLALMIQHKSAVAKALAQNALANLTA
jgi:hypothetical protein